MLVLMQSTNISSRHPQSATSIHVKGCVRISAISATHRGGSLPGRTLSPPSLISCMSRPLNPRTKRRQQCGVTDAISSAAAFGPRFLLFRQRSILILKEERKEGKGRWGEKECEGSLVITRAHTHSHTHIHTQTYTRVRADPGNLRVSLPALPLLFRSGIKSPSYPLEEENQEHRRWDSAQEHDFRRWFH